MALESRGFLKTINPNLHLHDHRVGLDDDMVDIATPPRLDGAALRPNRDPQGHLRGPVPQLEAGLRVTRRVYSTAEGLKYSISD